MNKAALKYVPAKRYAEELHSVMLDCFPEFWRPRFERGNYAFPYDVKMFSFWHDGEKVGQAGYHPYSFFACDTFWTTGGICDVGILPAFRSRGYSRILLELLCDKIIKKYDPLFIPLYTDKPKVYEKINFQVYFSEQMAREELLMAKGEKIKFSPDMLPMKKLWRRSPARISKEEEKKIRIACLYGNGTLFQGKCTRSDAVWDELFRDPDSEWVLGDFEYSLLRKGVLLETYCRQDPDKKTKFYTSCGGHDGNMVMLKICRKSRSHKEKQLLELINERRLIFPLSDVF